MSDNFSTRVIKSFLYSSAGNTFSKIINTIGLFVVLKLISPEAFGIASIVLAVFAVLQAVTELGLGISIVQALEITKRELNSLFWLSSLISGVLYFLIYISAPFIAVFYDQPLITNLIRAHGIIIILFTLYFVPRNILKRGLKFKELTIIDNVSLILSTIIMVILAYYNFGAWAIIGGEIANRVGQLILTQFYSTFWPQFQFNWPEIKSHVQFGLYATGSRLLYNLYSNADYLIVGRMFGAEAVGIYTLAYRIVADTVKTITSNFNEVAYPTFARLQNQVERLRKYFFTITKASLQINSLILVVITIFIEDLLLIGGYEEWIDAVPLIQILAFVAILRTVSPIIPQLLNAQGESRLNFYYSLSNAFIMPIAFFIGAQFSLIGVCISWLIGYPVVVSILFYYGGRLLELSFFEFVARIFSGIWFFPLLLLVGASIHFLLNYIPLESTLIILVLGIASTAGLGLYALYASEKETIKLLFNRAKS
ncbi:MAG: lipopolysaccharide biosynthesis protein [Balneolaceae bacterium]